MRSRTWSVLLAAAAVATAAPIAAQSALRWSGVFPTDASGAPPRLVVDAPYLSLSVSGHDGDSIHVVMEAVEAGLVTLPTPVLAGGILQLLEPRNTDRMRVEIRVPRRTAVSLRTSNYRPVTIAGIEGDIEVENSNSGIRLEGLRGAVVAATSNGAIDAAFDSLPARGPLSLLTSNAPVTLTLPAGAAADLLAETDKRVRSDFPVAPVEGAPSPARGRALRGRLGGGGVLIRVRTDNADIVIRRAEPSPPSQ
ncbi:MAG: hypothetical protein ABFS34_13680 [Gemmatimonadota bacterium]